jgi:DNA-binding protein HU-beta
MRKKAFIDQLAQTLNTSKSDAEKKVDTVFKAVSEVLAKNDEISWSGFGRFAVTHKAARMGRNPATGKPIKIAARAVPTFKAATALKRMVAKKVKPKPKASK